MTTYDPPQPNAALVVGPDDVLVLSFQGLERKQAHAILEHTKGRFPSLDGRVFIVSGAEQIAVVRKSEVQR